MTEPIRYKTLGKKMGNPEKQIKQRHSPDRCEKVTPGKKGKNFEL